MRSLQQAQQWHLVCPCFLLFPTVCLPDFLCHTCVVSNLMGPSFRHLRITVINNSILCYFWQLLRSWRAVVLLTIRINAKVHETEDCPLKSGSAGWCISTQLVNWSTVFRHSCFCNRSSLCFRDNKNSGFIMARSTNSLQKHVCVHQLKNIETGKQTQS